MNEKDKFQSELELTLIKNIKSFATSSELVYSAKDYTSATVLYFKTLFCIFDLLILKEKGLIPKDHSERFKILEKDFHDFYTFLDRNFPVYQSSYNVNIDKEVCDKIKEYAERLIKGQGI